MIRRIVIGGLAVVGVVAVIGAARSILSPRAGSIPSSRVPAIGGDTWPPVPLNPDRVS